MIVEVFEGLAVCVGSLGATMFIRWVLGPVKLPAPEPVEEKASGLLSFCAVPAAQGAYRTAQDRFPEMTEHEERFPPIASECPACGTSLKMSRCPNGHYSTKNVNMHCAELGCHLNLNETGVELVFCLGETVKGCKTKTPHLHQNCRRCGMRWSARTKSKCTE